MQKISSKGTIRKTWRIFHQCRKISGRFKKIPKIKDDEKV